MSVGADDGIKMGSFYDSCCAKAQSSDVMRVFLGRLIPELAAGTVEIKKLKCKLSHERSTNCLFQYKLTLQDIQGGDVEERVFYGSLDRRLDTRETGLVAFLNEGPARYYVAELEMLVWEFPYDPSMKSLRDLLTDEAMRDLLRTRPERFDVSKQAALQKSSVKLVRYHPQNRCVLEHRLIVRDGGHDVALHFFSKTFAQRSGAAIYDAMDQLWRNMNRFGKPGIPKPLYYDADRRTMYLSALEGPPAIDLILGERMPQLAADTGNMMSSFHRSSVAGLEERSLEKDLRMARRGPAALKFWSEDAGTRGGRIASQLEARVGDTNGFPLTPLHGAFRLNQMVVTDHGPGIVDFDGLCTGNPLSDVGAFVGYVLFRVARKEVPPDRGEAIIGHFLASYRESTPWGAPDSALRWYVTAFLLGKHLKNVAERSPNRYQPGSLERLLDLAERVMDGRQPF